MLGFQQVKVVRSSRGVSAFIEFVDGATAVACHNAQQGMILHTSDRGPIRLQFSKNPFGLGGKKRDANGIHANFEIQANGCAASVAKPGQPAARPTGHVASYAMPLKPAVSAAYSSHAMYGKEFHTISLLLLRFFFFTMEAQSLIKTLNPKKNKVVRMCSPGPTCPVFAPMLPKTAQQPPKVSSGNVHTAR